MDPNEIVDLARLVRRQPLVGRMRPNRAGDLEPYTGSPPSIRLRPITPGELALFAKTGHRRCNGGGRIVYRAVGDKPGGPSERTGICPCAARKVWQAQLDGRLADDEGVLCVVERAGGAS